eukprot:8801642-Alexandrium_andersonii.AAC.1
MPAKTRMSRPTRRMRKPVQENTRSPRTTAMRKHRAIFFLSHPSEARTPGSSNSEPKRTEKIKQRTSAPGPTRATWNNASARR